MVNISPPITLHRPSMILAEAHAASRICFLEFSCTCTFHERGVLRAPLTYERSLITCHTVVVRRKYIFIVLYLQLGEGDDHFANPFSLVFTCRKVSKKSPDNPRSPYAANGVTLSESKPLLTTSQPSDFAPPPVKKFAAVAFPRSVQRTHCEAAVPNLPPLAWE